MYPDLSFVVIILRRLINLGRYFVGISWGFFHLSSGNHVTRENIFRNFIIAIASIAFSNGATNCDKNFPFYRFFFIYCVCITTVLFFLPYFSLAHVCHVVGSCEYAGTMWPFNGTFSQWLYIIFRFKFNYAESDLNSRMECNSAFCWEIP